MIGVNTKPAIKPPIWAKYATPPPLEDMSLDKEKNYEQLKKLRKDLWNKYKSYKKSGV